MINLYNDFIEDMAYYDDRIYFMDEFDYLFDGMTPTEIIRSVDGDFNVHGEYFTHDGYRWISLFSDADLVDYIMADEFIEWLLDEEFITIFIDESGTKLNLEGSPIFGGYISEESLTRDEVIDFLVDNLDRLAQVLRY